MDFPALLDDHYVNSRARMLVFVRPLRPYALSLMILLLGGCGGGSGGESGDGTPTGPTAEDLTLASSAALKATLDLSTNRVTLAWWNTFPNAQRYQIEQQDGSGAWVVIDGLWATQQEQGVLQWTGPYQGPVTLRVEAVLQTYTVPLKLFSSSTSVFVAPPAQIPSIILDQPEPLESPINVSIGEGTGSWLAITYGIDTRTYYTDSPAPEYATSLSTDGIKTGTHRLSASIELDASSTLVIGKSVQIHTSAAAMSVSAMQSPDVIDIYAVATSDSGINSVVAGVQNVTASEQAMTMPNACLPQPCNAGEPFNAYHFSFSTNGLGLGYHYIAVQATDNAGNTVTDGQGFNLPTPTTVTLDSLTDGAVVAGTLHLAGVFFSGTPGALELLVTLSGVPVYDTSVANTGAVVPYSADISLAGVSPGDHTVSVYARVGNTLYTPGATAIVRVVAAH
jgi:hypothetical protein